MRLFRSARWLMLALLVSLVPLTSRAGVFISVNFGPPVLPVYVQPICPAPDLIWTPGYWAYGPDGYYWVPGAWVPAPFVGGLWTPGYWGWGNGLYVFHPGYWGYHVGYYGGVNYGGGYLGIGFAGGEWRGGHMAYNTAVVHVNETVIHTTFVDRTVINRYTVANPGHVAYAGGPGGIQHSATAQEQIAAHETHTAPTSFQTQHVNAAQNDHSSYAKVNGGHPTTLAAARPLAVEAHPAPARTAVTPSRTATQSYAPRTTTTGTSHSNGQAAQTFKTTDTSSPKFSTQERPATSTHTTPAAPAAHTPAPPRTNTAPARPAPKSEGHPK